MLKMVFLDPERKLNVLHLCSTPIFMFGSVCQILVQINVERVGTDCS